MWITWNKLPFSKEIVPFFQFKMNYHVENKSLLVVALSVYKSKMGAVTPNFHYRIVINMEKLNFCGVGSELP